MDSAPAAAVGLVGPLMIVLFAAVPLAFVASLALLALYRRAVTKRMLQKGSAAPRGPATTDFVSSETGAGPPQLNLEIVTHDLSGFGPGLSGFAWRSAGVSLAAGLAFACVMATGYLSANGFGFDWLVMLFLVVYYAWPAAIAIALVASTSWLATAAVVLAYALVLAGVSAIATAGTGITPGQLAQVWLNGNAEGTLLALLFLVRPIRAVGPIVVTFMIAAVAGALALVLWIGSSEPALAWVGEVGEALHLGAWTGPLAILLVGAIAAGLIAWLLLRWLGAAYRRGSISDQSIMIDAVFLTFAILYGISLSVVQPFHALAPVAAFLVAKGVSRLGTWLVMPPAGPDPRAPRLLLLRVFALGRRSERLFGLFAKLWRLNGGTGMIAGPDLVASTVEPHQFMDFLAGDLSRSFISGEAALDARLAESVPRRDRDGRFRVASYFCYDDTWKMTLARLAACHDAVLMDLRGFTAANLGASFEIQELLSVALLRRIVFIVDATTDMQALAETAAKAWQHVGARSPNRQDPAPRMRLYRLPGGPGLGVAPLHALVAEAALQGP